MANTPFIIWRNFDVDKLYNEESTCDYHHQTEIFFK